MNLFSKYQAATAILKLNKNYSPSSARAVLMIAGKLLHLAAVAICTTPRSELNKQTF
jgi:hypothetical protein